MKIIVQNGCSHSLSRSEVESIVSIFPSGWRKHVSSIVLYQSKGEIKTRYYKKEQTLGLFGPMKPVVPQIKVLLIQELLIALGYIAENADLPQRISKSARLFYLEKTSVIREHCLRLVNKEA